MAITKLSSLTIFFPFLNDAGTVRRQIRAAYSVGKMLTNDLEVIAIHGGNSKDNTLEEIKRISKEFPKLKMIDKTNNDEGYAVIKHGFLAATREWVFYTDGDAQYHLEEDLPALVKAQLKTKADVVNGYKKRRGDGIIRTVLGDGYAIFSRMLLKLPIRDTDCDFRLIKRSFLQKITLKSKDSTILAELLKKLEYTGASFAEIPVNHYSREYGSSNYTPYALFKEKIIGDFNLYLMMKKIDPDGPRVIKFAIVGFSSILIQGLIFNLLIIFLKMSPTLATIISDQVAIAWSFIVHNNFTFGDIHLPTNSELYKKFGLFYLIVMTSTLLQALTVFAGTSLFGDSLLVSNISLAIGVIIGFFWNYSLQSVKIWKVPTK